MASEKIRTRSKAHASVNNIGRTGHQSMSAFSANLEDGSDNHYRTRGRHRSASHDEATVHSAITTSGVSTGSRRRRKSRSSSLSGEVMSGPHEQQKPKGTRRRQKRPVNDHFNHSIATSIASAPTGQPQQQQLRRSGRRSSSPKKRRSRSGSRGGHASLSPKRNSGQPRMAKRSLSPRVSGGSRVVQRSISPNNTRQASGDSRAARRRSREKSPGQQHSPERSLRTGRRRGMPTESNLHNSVGALSLYGEARSVATAPARRGGRHSRSPHRKPGGASVPSMGTGRKPKARSLSPLTRGRRAPTALESLLGKEGREQEQKIRTRMQRSPRPPELPKRVQSDIVGHDMNGANHRHPRISDKAKVRHSHDHSRPENEKGSARLRGPATRPQRMQSDTIEHHVNAASPKHRISDKAKSLSHSHDNSRNEKGRVPIPGPTIRPQRVQSDIIGDHMNGDNHKYKISDKPKVRRHSHDIHQRNEKGRARMAGASPTRKVLDSEVTVLTLNQEKKLISTSMTSMFSDDDWGESSFSEAFKPQTMAVPQRTIQRVASKSHRMKLDEMKDRNRSQRARVSPTRLTSSATSAGSEARHDHSTRQPRRMSAPFLTVPSSDGPDSEDESSPFAIVPAGAERLTGPLEKWGKDAKRISQH